MKRIKVGNGAIKITDGIQPPKCPANLFQPHFRVGICGASGSGKTTLCVNLLQAYQQANVFDRYILISPSGSVDEFTGIRAEPKWGSLRIDKEYHDLSTSVIQEIQEEQKNLILAYKNYEEDLNIWKRWRRYGDEQIAYHELLMLHDKYNFKKPVSPNDGKDRYPTVCIIADDCVSQCQSKSLADFISRSRHSLASVFILVQHIYQISRATRKSLSGLVIFRTADKKIRKELYAEYASADMNENEFENILGGLTERTDYLVIDLNGNSKGERYKTNFV